LIKLLGLMTALLIGLPPEGAKQDVALLLFDGETGREFVGCLNCNRYDPSSVCNQYGEYGSRYQQNSIWNQYGPYGSRYAASSPWNRYGNGLRIVDGSGNYYGRFTLSRTDRSRLPLVAALLAAYEADGDLAKLRDALCE
jgi:hypothetical protein